MKANNEQLLAVKIFTQAANVAKQVLNWKAAGSKIVFTNGVFDLLHIGHITYLAKAAMEGDKLVLGLNSDASVKRIKGENRPVNEQATRAVILAALFFVDAIIIFEEDTPIALIKQLEPDVLIKGADYSIDQIVGGKEVLDRGGEVKTIDFVEGHSSSLIIQKIRQTNHGAL
jgi:rfaE bifunctional protein nucleotidyltransferase chain/domain